MLTRARRMIGSNTPAFASAGGQHSVSALASGAVLAKLAKHLALLACLAIVGQASGRAAIGALAIFSLVVIAAVLHSIGRALLLPEPKPANRRHHEL